MYIYHYTTKWNIPSIVEKGLVYGNDRKSIIYGEGTGAINYVLEKHRPEELPILINRDKCIFFEPFCTYNDFGNTEIKVDIKNLDKSKLYVADYEYAQQIWEDTVDYSYSGERSDIPLEESARNYWSSLRTFDEYLKNNKSKKVEVLYFGKIPFKDIEVTTTLHPLSQEIFGVFLKKNNVKRWSSTYGHVYTSEKQFFKVYVDHQRDEAEFVSKTGHINEGAISLFEENFTFDKKEVINNGSQKRINYIGLIKIKKDF